MPCFSLKAGNFFFDIFILFRCKIPALRPFVLLNMGLFCGPLLLDTCEVGLATARCSDRSIWRDTSANAPFSAGGSAVGSSQRERNRSVGWPPDLTFAQYRRPSFFFHSTSILPNGPWPVKTSQVFRLGVSSERAQVL